MLTKTKLPPPGSADVLYLVDLSGYVFRAYHAIAPLTSPSGEPTHATYGTVAMLTKLVDERKPAYLAVAMDSPGKTFRDALDNRYKAHRPPPPEDLSVQMNRCREIVDAYNIPIFIEEGLEADDLIAAAVSIARANHLRVVIASSDKDLMQLVEPESVMLWDAMRDKVYGPPEVEEKFGVRPDQVRDLLALVGDTSDNVPGVPGVGMKTAADLLREFGTFDGVYNHVNDVKKNRIRESLIQNRADAEISRTLVTLKKDVTVHFDLEALRYGGADHEKLRSLFTELGFTRFVKSLPPPKVNLTSGAIRVLQTEEALQSFVESILEHRALSIVAHGTSENAMTAGLCGISLAISPNEGAYIPLSHRYVGAPVQLSLDKVKRILEPALQVVSIGGHDVKFTQVLLRCHGIGCGAVQFDSMLASYLIDPEANHSIEYLSEKELSAEFPTYDSIAPKRRGKPQQLLDEIEVEQVAAYAAKFSMTTCALRSKMEKRIATEKLDSVMQDIELPVSEVLAEMEYVGVLVNTERLHEIGRQMSTDLIQLEQKAKNIIGQDFNLASPKQLETILYDELKLKPGRKTKTGRSTDAEALEAIVDDHPLPAIVLEHRAISKLKGTYVDALPKLIHPKTRRIHTQWRQAVAATGRISSQDPNLQNIPIRTTLGKSIRGAFVAPKGFVFMSADYSQIELRVLAHLSQDQTLMDAFVRGQDVHVRTAMEIFGVSEEQVTSDMRRQSKTINFGVIYGIGEVALSKQIGIKRVDAAKFIDAYFERYKGVARFMEKTLEDARRSECVHTLFGRRRLLPDLRSTDRMRSSYAERIAQNTPIQGTAADLLKLAMIKLKDPVVPGARMVLTVHDELAFEVPEDHIAQASERIRAAMENVHRMDVPLVVDVGWGPTWADAH